MSCSVSLVVQEMQVEELTAVRQTLQADLETSIRRIVDLQAALEEVESSDESDSERYERVQASWNCLGGWRGRGAA